MKKRILALMFVVAALGIALSVVLWNRLNDGQQKAAALKAEEAALAERRKKKENKAEALKTYLANAMLAVGKDKLETSKVALSFRRSQSVEITDESLIPEEFMKYKPTVDKAGVKAALKDGAFIPGASLVDNNNLQIK